MCRYIHAQNAFSLVRPAEARRNLAPDRTSMSNIRLRSHKDFALMEELHPSARMDEASLCTSKAELLASECETGQLLNHVVHSNKWGKGSPREAMI